MYSNEKLEQKWKAVWAQWNDIINEVGDEDGEYISQEEDWEPPYFDGEELTADLETVALDIFPLLEPIYALGIEDENLFFNALEELGDAIRSYPEWMGMEYVDPCYLERQTSHCMFQWLYLCAKDDAQPTAFLLESLVALEDVTPQVNWHNDSLIEFFDKQTEAMQRAVFAYFQQNHETTEWQSRLNSKYNAWSLIYQNYAKRFDKVSHLQHCRQLLKQDWTQGRPLIDAALAQGNDTEAEKLLQQTLNVYLGRADKSTSWQKEKVLFLEQTGYREYIPAIYDLLVDWQKVTKRLGKSKDSQTLQLQTCIYQQPYDIAAIKVTYQAVHSTLGNIAETLFKQWQTYLLVEMQPQHYRFSTPSNHLEPEQTWSFQLLSAALEADKVSVFIPYMRNWLQTLQDNAQKFQQETTYVALLTIDMANLGFWNHTELLKVIQMRYGDYDGSGKAGTLRRQCLAQFQVEQFQEDLEQLWRVHILLIAPNPGAVTNGRYSEHAQWLHALKTFEPAAHDKLLSTWKNQYKNRRNLWKAIG
ncbi:hypothetical protein QUF61_15430 [Candidatus Venteria ishoeyi]|uniref:hypothetical protein n=1 Tax=Candidatus Venteria ishoeyi TaxID=1899563 RepID=UPI0025A51FAC|nr:hypothetical protein [Candidatus Venteria ishoeyi]MDM8547879.1 hypothetical protein [Candidatus Venteria ishoeyi]